MSTSSLHPHTRATLDSIIVACQWIIVWTNDLKEHGFWDDKLKRAAIERQFEVIGEALSRLRLTDAVVCQQFTDADGAICFGEVIRRDFDNLDYGTVWRAIQHDVPRVLAEAERIIQIP